MFILDQQKNLRFEIRRIVPELLFQSREIGPFCVEQKEFCVCCKEAGAIPESRVPKGGWSEWFHHFLMWTSYLE